MAVAFLSRPAIPVRGLRPLGWNFGRNFGRNSEDPQSPQGDYDSPNNSYSWMPPPQQTHNPREGITTQTCSAGPSRVPTSADPQSPRGDYDRSVRAKPFMKATLSKPAILARGLRCKGHRHAIGRIGALRRPVIPARGFGGLGRGAEASAAPTVGIKRIGGTIILARG
jgi:hypothetical protein